MSQLQWALHIDNIWRSIQAYTHVWKTYIWDLDGQIKRENDIQIKLLKPWTALMTNTYILFSTIYATLRFSRLTALQTVVVDHITWHIIKP